MRTTQHSNVSPLDRRGSGSCQVVGLLGSCGARRPAHLSKSKLSPELLEVTQEWNIPNKRDAFTHVPRCSGLRRHTRWYSVWMECSSWPFTGQVPCHASKSASHHVLRAAASPVWLSCLPWAPASHSIRALPWVVPLGYLSVWPHTRSQTTSALCISSTLLNTVELPNSCLLSKCWL